MLGLPVAERLRQDGFDVTIMSTRPDEAHNRLGDRFSIVGGDVSSRESLKAAIDGHDFVYLNLNAKRDPVLYERIEIGGSRLASEVSQECGVKRIIAITGASSKGEEKGIIFLDAKVRAERAIIESGVPYSIMRASWFFESLPHFIRNNKLVWIGKQPIPRGWLAASDYARQVSAAFRKPEAANRCFYNLGPEKITIGDAVRRFGEVCHPEMKAQYTPIWIVRLAALFTGREDFRTAADFFAYFDKQDEDVDSSETDRLLGANTTTLEQWTESYKGAP